MIHRLLIYLNYRFQILYSLRIFLFIIDSLADTATTDSNSIFLLGLIGSLLLANVSSQFSKSCNNRWKCSSNLDPRPSCFVMTRDIGFCVMISLKISSSAVRRATDSKGVRKGARGFSLNP